jgi:hypothetical protein
MPGSEKNEWSSYLNGNASEYNFSYRNKTPVQDLQPSPNVLPTSIPTQKPVTMQKNITLNKRKNNSLQKGGRRKTKAKKVRHTYKK